MDSLLNRYRNITVLLLVIFAQLILLAYQVKSNQDVRLIRVWAVTAVTPLARVIEGARAGTVGVLEDYFVLHNLREENRTIRKEMDKLKLDNQYLQSQLETADRVKALAAFQTRSPSQTVVSRVIGTSTGTNARAVFIDRGSTGGVQRGMAVITPDGIVGKVTAAYPTASQVLLITDPNFAAGVISQKHRVHGTVRGLGYSSCKVDYIQTEEPVDPGERFFTSGDDGVFPKGLPVGTVTVARPGNPFKEVFLNPSGLQGGLEEVLIVLDGAHQAIPELQQESTQIHLQPPPPTASADAQPAAAATPGQPQGTEADRLRERYQQIGGAQGHKFGEGTLGTKPPNFNLRPEDIKKPATPPAAAPAVTEQEPVGEDHQDLPASPPLAKPKPEPAKPATGAQR